MEVQVYVYDLSRGMARTLSVALLGIQIDAIYHTSIIMEGIEYVYDAGIKTVEPGKTHLGKPMQIIGLGATSLPMDVIMEYLESLKAIYTAEAYDIWSHNCNNFSNDFATFLLGKGIPEHITNLPQTVLDTPFGRMIQPQVNGMIENSKKQNGGLLGIENAVSQYQTHQSVLQSVRKASALHLLDGLLAEAEKSCAVIFFTSPTSRACTNLYSLFSELAIEAAHKAVLITVDISSAHNIATHYSIRATPTFITFLHGKQENRWTGGNPNTLRCNLRNLVQMARPPHKHQSLQLPTLLSATMKPVLYGKLPTLEKLKAKMGPAVADDVAIAGVMRFVFARAKGLSVSTLPDLDAFSRFLRSAPSKLPPEIIFTIVDLLRIALVDARFSRYYAEEKDHKTIAPLLSYVNSLRECPYSLRLVALQAACNLFSSSLYLQHILTCSKLTIPIVQLITASLLNDGHHNVRVAAASLCSNMTAANSHARIEEHGDALSEDSQIELAASLLEAIRTEERSPEALRGLLLAFGHLAYCAPNDGVLDLMRTMDARSIILAKKKLFPSETLVGEVGEELLSCI